MSAPGAGKTSLLERALAGLDVRVGVLEGDVQGSIDADRIAHLHVPVVQLNTDGGFGGECHLDANMVRSALPDLDLDDLDLLVVENVGNLVCPAEFRVGEDAKAMICSVTEGEDKPIKYPLMFRTCESSSSTRSTCSRTSTSTSACCSTTSPRSIPRRRSCGSAPGPARGSRSSGTGCSG